MIKSISDFSRKRELSILKKESEDGKKTRTPEPWPHFRKEIEARMSDSPADKIKEFGLENYDEETLSELKPIFISHANPEKSGWSFSRSDNSQYQRRPSCRGKNRSKDKLA